jgi:hypothetical protein
MQSSILDVPMDGMSRVFDKLADMAIAGPPGFIPVDYIENNKPAVQITHIEAYKITRKYIDSGLTHGSGILKSKTALCNTCYDVCGCLTCEMRLPCACLVTPRCDKCGKFNCNCATLASVGLQVANGLTGIINMFNTNMNTITSNYNVFFQNFSQTMNQATQQVLQLSPTATNNPTFVGGGASLGVAPVSKLSAPPPRTGLSTGPAYYNPSMLEDGTDEQKLARRKAIEFRNMVLGKQGCKSLYSPGGLSIKSKLFPGVREYRFYAHHVSCQVYEYGVNVGRLDVHADYKVPMGDTHLAAIMKCMFDEEDMIKTAAFSPVRDI